jgi:hypothetical protein
VTGGGTTTVNDLAQGNSSHQEIFLNGTRTIGNGAGEGVNGKIIIYNPSEAQFTNVRAEISFTGTAAGESAVANTTGQRLSAADVDAFRLLFDTGNITSGQVIVRGYNSSAVGGGASSSTYFSGNSAGSISTATATYIGEGNSASNVTESSVDNIVPYAAVLRNLYVKAETAPSAAESFVYTVRVNRVDTAITATISNTDTTANDTSNSVTIAAGDTICVEVDGSAGSASSFHKVSFEIDPV